MPRESIAVQRLQPGLYIELPLKWNEHPFLMGRFRLKDQDQIKIIRQLGLEQVWYYPEKSQAQPIAEDLVSQSGGAGDAPATQEEVQSHWDKKEELAEKLRRRRQQIQQVERQYGATVDEVKTLMAQMASSPVQAMNDASKVVGSIVATLAADKEVLVQLMNTNNLDDTAYFHALNVSVLSLLVARDMGIGDREQLMTLGLAALLHDIGHVKLPSQLLRKTTAFTKPEAELYARHVRFATDMIAQHAKLKLTVKPLLLTLIEQHHLFLDGSGYPADIAPSKMHPLSKVLAVVNYYDKLCNHNDPMQSMTPHEALSLMFSKQSAKFDKVTLQALVKMLGIYPPGTVVQLSDESFAIVIYLNRKDLLKPGVLIYSADVPKAESVIIDLSEQSELTIRKSLRPSQLTKEVYEYLSPRERISYFLAFKDGDTQGT
jgi:HD-GYP domain-containing protein (c-di-GMP phosphodiesterase class II)